MEVWVYSTYCVYFYSVSFCFLFFLQLLIRLWLMSYLFSYEVRKLTFTWNKKKKSNCKGDMKSWQCKVIITMKSSVQNWFKLFYHILQECEYEYDCFTFISIVIIVHFLKKLENWKLTTVRNLTYSSIQIRTVKKLQSTKFLSFFFKSKPGRELGIH